MGRGGGVEAPFWLKQFGFKPFAKVLWLTNKIAILRATMELVIFFIFVFVRAAHPVVIASSRTDVGDGRMGFAYQSGSTVIMMTVPTCVLNLIFCFGWESRWTASKGKESEGTSGNEVA